MQTKGQLKRFIISLRVAALVFILMIIAGLASRVSLLTVLLRAAGGAVVTYIMIYIFLFYLRNYLLPSMLTKNIVHHESNKGHKVDITAGIAEEDISSLLQPNPTDNELTNNTDEKAAQFVPLAQQIDPNLQKSIRENPEQAAEVVRKMGLDK